MDFNIFGSTPEYYSGLLGQEATDKLRKRATGTGIANALLALVAQPRNQGYGSALPYIGKALMAGQQAGQNVIQGGLREFDVQQRLAEMKRQQEQREAQRQFINTLPENQKRAALAFPQVAAKAAENMAIPQPTAKLLTLEEQVSFGLPATGRFQQKADGTFEQVSGTTPQAPNIFEVQEGRNKVTYQANPDGTITKIATGAMDAPQRATSTSYKTETDASGNLVYIPSVPGLPVLDQRGQPTSYTPAATKTTEGERKAGTLLKRLEFSQKQLIDATDPLVGGTLSAQSPNALAEAVSVLPLIGDVSKRAINSENRQRVEAAQLDILDAALTLGTGAAYTKEQLEGYRESYFPQVGDNPKTIQDKAARLQNIIESAKIAAGSSGKSFDNPTNNFNLNNIAIEPRVSQKPRLKYNMATGRFE